MKFKKNVKELGNLEVKSYSAKKILLKKEKQGQVLVSVSNTVDTITLTHIRSFNTTDGPSRTISITGIDMFDDLRIVMADNRRFNNQLFIMNHEGRFIKTIRLEDQCFDVAVIEKNTVAITLVKKKKIVFIDVNSSTEQRSIYTRYRCYGIYYTGEQLVVTLDNLTIQFVDLSGNTLSILSIGKRSLYCSMFNNKLYYTTQGGAVSCVYSIDLNEVVGGVKSSAAFADLEDRAKDTSVLIGNLITEKQNNRESLGVQKNKIISEVQNIRAGINNHLLKLEKDLLDKLDNMEKKQNEHIESFIQKLSEMRRKVENISVDLEKTKQHVSNFQAFLGIHEWNKIIEIEEKDCMFLQTDQIMNHRDIHITC
ncbi:unnamed protein product [Mytilus coruscus]|uniref:Uncharacterized protein n=1 Tax=Mytilus coruscus TaxID=42192 RepID=A0A6J8EV68_MYTCO|nr:unnamed protein product [Mytilus coruscus]